MARIPAKTVTVSDKETLRNLERDLKMVVYGQDQAIDALAQGGIADLEHTRHLLQVAGRQEDLFGELLVAGLEARQLLGRDPLALRVAHETALEEGEIGGAAALGTAAAIGAADPRVIIFSLP